MDMTAGEDMIGTLAALRVGERATVRSIGEADDALGARRLLEDLLQQGEPVRCNALRPDDAVPQRVVEIRDDGLLGGSGFQKAGQSGGEGFSMFAAIGETGSQIASQIMSQCR